MSVEAEKAKIEAQLVTPFRGKPARLWLWGGTLATKEQAMRWTLDELGVLRVNPHYDSAGQVLGVDFFFYFRPIGKGPYTSTAQGGHLLKGFTPIEETDSYERTVAVEMPGNLRGWCFIEELMEGYPTEAGDLDAWKAWQEEKKRAPEEEAAARAADLEAWTEQADGWDEIGEAGGVAPEDPQTSI